MIYKNRRTGEKFIHLAIAQNLESMKNHVVFCPDDSEHSVFTMQEDKFYSEYETVVITEKAA